MGRVTQSSKTIVANVAFYMLKTIMSLVIRTLFIYSFGMEYLGLNSLFANILSILSLAELGIGSAIVYSMYKPMAENDYVKVSSLMALYKKFYAIIALIIAVVGIALIPILPLIVDFSSVADINVNLVYLITLTSTIITYFMAHRRALLLTSQNKYIESWIGMAIYVLAISLQVIVLFFIKNYYLYIGITIITSITESLVIFIVTQKKFPQVGTRAPKVDADSKKLIGSNTRSILCHKLGGVVLNSTDSLVIQIVLGSLVMSAIYANYWMIYSTIVAIVCMIVDAAQGSIGNLIAVGDKDSAYLTFKRLNFAFSWIVGFCSIALLCMYNPFISFMWGAENIWGFGFVLSVVGCFYINMSRQLAYYFKISAGLFKQDKYAPLIEAFLNLVISILLVYWLGPAGVVLGTLISCLLVPFWNIPRILFKEYFKRPISEYWKDFIKYFVVTIIVGVVTYFMLSVLPTSGFGWLILKFALCAILPNAIYLLIYFRKTEFLYFFDMFKKIVFKLLHKKDFVKGDISDNNYINIGVDFDKDGISDVEIPISIESLTRQDD